MDLGVAEMLGCGALAGACGQTMAYPFDVARRRLQVYYPSFASVECFALSSLQDHSMYFVFLYLSLHLI